jgi:PAS domain-containing protein
MEKRYVRKDGSLIWILLTVALVRGVDSAPQYLIASHRRIAEGRCG